MGPAVLVLTRPPRDSGAHQSLRTKGQWKCFQDRESGPGRALQAEMVEQGCALRGELGWSSAVPCPPQVYMYQLFRSLAYIHSQGVCHRDIKPQNLLVDPDTAVLKLCDFGRWASPGVGWVAEGARRGPNPWPVLTPAHIFPQCKTVGPRGAQCLLHLFSLLPGPRADLRSHRLHLIHRSDLREGWGWE